MATYDIDFENVVAIILSRNQTYDQFVEELEMSANIIYDEFRKSTGLDLSFSGSITNDIMNIHISYYEAKTALDYIWSEDNRRVLWYKKDGRKNELLFYYPLDKELELLEAIVNSNEEKCRNILNEIYRLNFIKNNLTKNIGLLLLNSIVSTLLRAAEKIPNEYEYISGNVREFIGRFTGESDIELQFKELRKYILDFCKRVNESKRSERTGLIKQIIDFIDANYQDCQISLASVASKFNITESYLSRFFKEQTGENFSKYIERLRMEKAHELLNKQNLPVSAVAEKVGYNYPQVFRRVYKRYFGITPSMSRKN